MENITSADLHQAWLKQAHALMGAATDIKDMAYMGQVINDSIVSIGDDGQSIYDPNKPYGLIWDDNADTYLRINHGFFPIQTAFKRIVCDGNPMFGGTVFRYLDKDNSALFEDGTDATSYVTGAEGGNYQVFVEQPKYYYLAYKIGTLNYNLQSLTPFAGSKTREMFRKTGWADTGDGTDKAHECAFGYVSAFEGVRTVGGTPISGTGLAISLDTGTDKILSIAGYKPLTIITRAESRLMIANGGSKQFEWHRYTVAKECNLIEFGTHNSQSMTPGYTEKTSGGTYAGSVVNTGATLPLGNNSGSITGTADGNGGTDTNLLVIANSYRGIENFYGHLWQWVDAVNITNAQPFTNDIFGTFEDDVFTGEYSRAKDSDGNDITNPLLGGYQSTLNSGSFFPKTIGSDSDSKITDFYNYTSGSRVFKSGGALVFSPDAGASCLNATNYSSNGSWNICCRT